MTWIIVLILVGLILIFVEIFFVPGTTIVGILGLIFASIGIYIAYDQYNANTGHLTLFSTLLILIIFIIVGAKSGIWSKLSNKDIISGKVNVIEPDLIKAGDKGMAVSAIRPIGKARINDMNFEVRSLGTYIDEGSTIEVIRVEGNKITIKPVEEKAQ
jgi:membrane-bound ClpP family serine protease